MATLLRRTVLAAGLSVLALSAALVQDFPTKPIDLVVPYPAGGSTDVVGRKLGQKLGELLGKPVVIDNRGGAGGNIGTTYVARSPADGYRLLMATSALVTLNPHVYANAGFDPFKDFAPVSMISGGAIGIGVSPSLGVNSLPELVKYVKANPRKVFYGTPSAGTPQHVIGELLNQAAGMDMTAVHYKGVAPALNDLIAGNVQVLFSTYAALKPQADSGRVKVLAVAENKRIAAAPGVPTVAEAYPGFEMTTWFGIFAPASTPRPVLQKLEQAFMKIVAQDDVKELLNSLALPPADGSAQALARALRSDYDRLGKVVREKGVKVE